MGFSRGHQGRQGHRPHDYDDNEEEDDEVEDNDKDDDNNKDDNNDLIETGGFREDLHMELLNDLIRFAHIPQVIEWAEGPPNPLRSN